MLEDIMRYRSHRKSQEKENGKEKIKVEGKQQRSLQAS